MKQFNSETELAEQIITYLKEMGWEVYQEVQVRSFGNIADIVAVQNNLVWVLECKLSLGLTVISQALSWRNRAHYVSIVVPSKRRSKAYDCVNQILEYFGIGCYEVHPSGSIVERAAPKLNRTTRRARHIKSCLMEEQKTWAKAGNAHGRRYTPFQNTKTQLICLVTKTPGLTIKELISGIQHHYRKDSTARSCILQWIRKGIITELRLEHDGKKYRVYPTRRKDKK